MRNIAVVFGVVLGASLCHSTFAALCPEGCSTNDPPPCESCCPPGGGGGGGNIPSALGGGGSSGGCGSCGGSGLSSGIGGLPVFWVSEWRINLRLEDEPSGYQPARGPRIAFRLSYRQSDS